MKKILKIAGITVLVLLVLLIATPFVFKGKIEKYAMKMASENLMVDISWDKLGLSLISAFPDLKVTLRDFSMVNRAPFEGDTLFACSKFGFGVDLVKIIKGDIVVKSILIDDAVVNALSDMEGHNTWDIMPPDDEEEPVDSTAISSEPAEQGDRIALDLFKMKNSRVVYDDVSMPMTIVVNNLDLTVRGGISMASSLLDIHLQSDDLSAVYDGTTYLKGAGIDASLKTDANIDQFIFQLMDVNINLNGLVLGAEGTFSMPGDDMLFDIRYFTREATLKTLLGFAPAEYLEGFENIRYSGLVTLDGEVTGIMDDIRNPDVSLNMVIKDGSFAYPDLPKDVKDIQMDLKVFYDGGSGEKTTVDLKNLSLDLGGNPFAMHAFVATPMGDMQINAGAKGSVDFSTLADVIPLDDSKLAGKLDLDLVINTRMSYIDNEDYENVDVKGQLRISDILFESGMLPLPVSVSTLAMDFTPRYVDLTSLDVRLGESDLHLDGKLTNFIPYVFKDETVSGNLNVVSKHLDLNALMGEEEEGAETAAAEESEESSDTLSSGEPLQIPANIAFDLQLDLAEVLYDSITINNIRGGVKVSNGTADLKGLHMELLDGSVDASGSLVTGNELPLADMVLTLKGIDIPGTYRTFNTVEKLAPVARYCKGTVNGEFTFKSAIDPDYYPVYETLYAKGRLHTKGLQVYNAETFVKVSELLKNEKFRDFMPDEVDIQFLVRDGKVIISPFDLKVSQSKITISGEHGIDQTLNYTMDFDVARSDLGEGANELLQGINALAANAGIKTTPSDRVKIKGRVGGTFDKPKFTTDLGSATEKVTEQVVEQVKEVVQEEVKKVETEVRQQASAEAEKILADAQKESDEILKKAKAAGDELVKQAKARGDQLIKDAGSNPVKKLAAEKSAEELNKQAKKQADNLYKEAETRAAQVMEKARTEAAKIK
ncbi:MAG: AsmA-like C-terminal region-containing protein [Bacteroidota bacterium]